MQLVIRQQTRCWQFLRPTQVLSTTLALLCLALLVVELLSQSQGSGGAVTGRLLSARLLPGALQRAIGVGGSGGGSGRTIGGGGGSGRTNGGGSAAEVARAREEACERPPAVKEAALEKFGCKLLRNVCLDQGRILLHTGVKTPGHKRFTPGPLFTHKTLPPILLPGFSEPLGSAHYMPASKFDLDIRAPTALDAPDVWRPAAFSNCTLPLIFFPHYFSIFADFFLCRVNTLRRLSAEGGFDSDVQLTVESNGLEPPDFYQTLLAPLSKHKVLSLASLSSRQHMDTGQPRCFSQLALCDLRCGWGQAKLTGRKIVEHYRALHPDKFQKAGQQDGVFRVAFFQRSGGMRRIVNQAEVLRQCNAWRLPAGSKYSKVECLELQDFRADNFADSLAQLQRVQALVGPHGSGLLNAFFLPTGSAVVEVLCWNFCGSWPDQYIRRPMERDQSVQSGYFRLRADKQHCLPGAYQRNRTGSPTAWARDQDVQLDFPVLSKALARIALGQVASTPANWGGRLFEMTAGDPDPAPCSKQKAAKQKQAGKDGRKH